MELWAWLAAYILGFALLSVYLYQYFSNRTSDANTASSNASGGVSSARVEGRRSRGMPSHPSAETVAEPPQPANLAPPEGVSHAEAIECQSCGAYNRTDRMFRYCRNCGERLG